MHTSAARSAAKSSLETGRSPLNRTGRPSPGFASSKSIDPIRAADLRRRRGRDLTEIITARAEWLSPDDRALLLAVYQDGKSALEVARLSGQPPRALRRRVRSLVRRVLSPLFEFVIRHRDDWPPTRRRVATACVLQGRTLRETATFLRLSLHTVRRQMEAVRALHEAERS